MTPTNFISTIANRIAPENSTNLYGNDEYGRIRRHNLERYMDVMLGITPTTLLLGEAPGHRGARLTGIPFTCETILKNHPFFTDTPYQFVNEIDLESEQSATIVWEALGKRQDPPLIWNIFPFHPHQPGDDRSNRSPTKAELQIGKEILLDLLLVFPHITRIAAVGRKAESMLGDFTIPRQYIRHPARGGKAAFTEGLKAFL